MMMMMIDDDDGDDDKFLFNIGTYNAASIRWRHFS